MTGRSSNITILLGFFLILILLAMLTWLSLSSMEQNSEHIEKIVNEQREMRNIFIMRDSAQRRALVLLRMTTTEDEFELDDFNQDFSNQAGIFIGARDRLLMHLNEDEQQIWNETREYVADGSRVQKETATLIQGHHHEKAIAKIHNDVIPIQDKVMAGMTRMLDQQNLQLSDELKATTEQNKNAYLATVVMGSIAVIIGIIAMIYVLWHSSRTEQLLLRQQKKAEQANQSKSNFLSNMSHEIRTPLTAIIGYSEILSLDGADLDKNKKVVASILRNGRHLLQLVNDVLDISKIEANSFEVESITVHPVEILSELDSIFFAKAASKNIQFKINYKYPVPKYIKSDPTRLKQILINLCSNAIKFTEQGEVVVDVSADLKKSEICFDVIDQGIGMKPDIIDRIFLPFVQADSSTTRKYGGTGLGLAISNELAEKMGGRIVCESIVNQGTRFTLSLPIGELDVAVIDNQAQLEKNDSEVSADEIYKLSGRVLLAEDNPDNQKLISMFINKTGADVTIVNNGEEAVKKALLNNYDLILMDMQMPVLDGLEAVKKLRYSGYLKPIVMLTANVVEKNRQICLEAGADDFLSKPIETSMFFRVLNKYLFKSSVDIVAENQKALMESDSYKKIAKEFIAHIPTQIDLLQKAIEREDWAEIEKVSHSLKGMGGSFGYARITELAGEVNTKSNEKQADITRKAISELADYCKTLS